MKKTKYLALVLVVAIALMGAGYAAWTQQIVVNGTLTTGDMDVIVGFAHLSKPVNTGGSVSKTDDSVTFEATNLYPTVYSSSDSNTFGRIHFSVENHSTFPVKLDSIDFTQINPTSPAWDYFKTSIHMHKGTIAGRNATSLGGPSVSLTGVNAFGMWQDLYLKDLDTILMMPNPNNPAQSLNNIVIQPGEAIWFGNEDPDLSSIRYWLDASAPNTTQNENIGFTLKLNWTQAN